jgi:hypothetical protein
MRQLEWLPDCENLLEWTMRSDFAPRLSGLRQDGLSGSAHLVECPRPGRLLNLSRQLTLFVNTRSEKNPRWMFDRRKELEASTRLDPDPPEIRHVRTSGHGLLRNSVFSIAWLTGQTLELLTRLSFLVASPLLSPGFSPRVGISGA